MVLGCGGRGGKEAFGLSSTYIHTYLLTYFLTLENLDSSFPPPPPPPAPHLPPLPPLPSLFFSPVFFFFFFFFGVYLVLPFAFCVLPCVCLAFALCVPCMYVLICRVYCTVNCIRGFTEFKKITCYSLCMYGYVLVQTYICIKGYRIFCRYTKCPFNN